ncbi:MAG: DUF502 domain-containing protein [Planctomycetota bacterium]
MNFKKIFIAGLILLLPMMITIFIITLAFKFINANFAQPLGAMILSVWDLITGMNISKEDLPIWRGIVGFPLVAIIIIFIGYLTSILGKKLFSRTEKYILLNIPIVNLVYPYAKQFIDTFISAEKKTEFKSVVAVEFPHSGIYATGFITADGLKGLRKHTGKKIITVFVATSPAPFTGFTLFVPEDKVIPLNITIDEALRIIMSGGVLTPPNQQTQPVEAKKED